MLGKSLQRMMKRDSLLEKSPYMTYRRLLSSFSVSSWRTCSAFFLFFGCLNFINLYIVYDTYRRRIRREAKNTSPDATARQSGHLTEQRNLLRGRIRAWEDILPIYMPGFLQRRAALESTSTAIHPEDAIIWLPSQIPAAIRPRVCSPELPDIEERIRTTHCYDGLDTIRHVLTVKSRMVMFKNKNVRGQREGTRSRAVIDRVHERVRAAAEKYRAARWAKHALAGEGEWEQVLQVLRDGDIRGYQDPSRLVVRAGRRGTLEDGQVEAEPGVGMGDDEGGDEGSNINLLHEIRGRRDGTGETRRTLSWIWITSSRSPNPSDEGDDILRAEWAKSRARAARCREEILLLREEMRRVLAFLEWKSSWWLDRINSRVNITGDLAEGLKACAQTQGDLQRALKEHFCAIWRSPLTDSDDISELDGNGEDDGHADDDDDDDDNDDEVEGDDLEGANDDEDTELG